MKNYELTYLLSPELSEEDFNNNTQKIIAVLQEEGGEALEGAKPVRKRLSPPIKKQRQAWLGVLNISFNPEKLESFLKRLRLEPQIIRFLITVKEPARIRKIRKETKPKIVKKIIEAPQIEKSPEEKKVEIEEIEKKLAEILGEI